MRLRLASLVLLLLALCRFSSSSSPQFTIETVNKMTSSSSAMIKDGAKVKSSIGKSPGSSKPIEEAKTGSLMEKLGNTLLDLAFGIAEVKPSKAIYEAIENGVRCEAADTGNEALLKGLYPDGKVPTEENEEDQKLMKSDATGDMKIDCTTMAATPTDEQQCLCKDKKPAIWCILVKIKRTQVPKKCRADALTALKTAAPELWKEYDVEAYGTRPEDKHDKEFSGSATVEDIIKAETEDAAKKFCSAIDPAVETAVKDLFAADGFYWIAESVLYSVVFGSPEKTLEQYCTDDAAFKDSDYGKCVCKQETGVSFCILKVFAEFFKSKGYLDCTSNPKKFVAGSKPKQEDLPKLAKAAPVVAPTPAPGPGNDPNATTAKTPDAAATSSLLLASLSVAAAMLLRH